MKRHLSFFFLTSLLALGSAYSQKEYIEVMVKDTVALKPISYEFQVSSGLKFEYDYENPNAKEEFSKKLRASEDSLTTLLKDLGYDFKLNQNPDVNYTKELTEKRNYLVKIQDSVKTEVFKSRMKAQGYEYYITDITYENKQTKIKEIYTRLLKKARKRADLIAELSGAEIKELVSISESKSEFGVITSFIENFAYSRSYGATTTSFQFNAGVLEKSILVKYTIK